MKYQVISSGSKGNMTYIETSKVKVLLDAGISLKEAKNRTNIDFTKINAILITHEHTDHISNLVTIAKQSNPIIYLDKNTFNIIYNRYKDKISNFVFKFIEANKKYDIEDLSFVPLRLSHDSSSCLGFVFSSNKKTLGYVTDTGFIPLPYINLLKRLDHLIIEANHDIEMLNNSDRDWVLKQRILSVRGHMSNIICGEVINTIIQSKYLKTIVLAHLSEECNTEELAVDTVLGAIEGDYIPKIVVAKQTEALEMFDLED